MRIIYENKTLEATLSATTTAARFDLTNLQSTFFYETWRSTSKSAQRIVLNLASLQANYVYLRNYNFTSSVTLRIEANTSDSWGSPAFSQTLTYNSEYIILNFTSQTYDYWSLYIDDPTNTDAYVELGGLILGQSVDLPGMDPGQIFTTVTKSKAQFSVSQNLYGNEDIDYREKTIKFPALSFEEKKTINDIYKQVKNVTPVLIIVWEDALDKEPPIYCNINKIRLPYQKSKKLVKPWSASLDFVEVF